MSLLQFSVDAGDEVLKQHLLTAGRNALYTSKEIQNQLILVCEKIIRNKLLQRISAAKFFSVIADEATDSANDEQLSISIRFAENCCPQEGFYQCTTGVTGKAITNYNN